MSSHLKRNFLLSIIFIIFHLVGAIGTVLIETRSIILPLTSINLVISAAILFFVHEDSRKAFVTFFIAIFCIGFGIEALGVHTAFPFGNYHYGDTLGWQIFGVPLVIGVNWFLLSYSIGMFVNKFSLPKWAKWSIAALAMTGMDALIEPVAIFLDYWKWEKGTIPIENYIAWFFISFFMQIIFTQLLNRSKNPVSSTLLVAQILYFLVLFIFINF